MIRFNTPALLEALDVERRARGRSWQELARRTGVSVSTMKRLEQGGRLEVDGMIAMVGWLGRTVESFTKRTAR